MRWVPFIALFLIAANTFAQGTGEVRLNIDPGHNFQFVLDDKYRMQKRSIELSSGEHNFKIWAPERVIVDTNINVVSDSTLMFSMVLPYSKDYEEWKQEMGRFQRKFTLYKVVPAAVTGGAAIWAIVSFSNYKKSSDQLNENEAMYHELVVPREITQLKAQIQEDKDDLSSAETQFIISTSVFAASAVATWFLFKKAKAMEVPVFRDKAKVEFDGLVYNPVGQESWAINMKLKF